MNPTTFESISQAILADADAYQAKMEQQCSDFQAKQQAAFNKLLEANRTQLLSRLNPPPSVPVAGSST